MTSPESPKPCVLIVDDNVELAEMMQLTLNRAGFEAHTAFSGYETLEWLAQNEPDAIILDLMMPGMNGFAILRHLRASENSRSLPVIVLTARADAQSRIESTSAGADDFLTKPVNTTELVEHVRRALALKASAPNGSHVVRHAA